MGLPDPRVKDLLDEMADKWNDVSFIEHDPISVPHRYSLPQDIEISGFFSAVFAWGNRTTIIRKALELMKMMDDAPYAFIQQHQDSDLKRIENFVHRTFQGTDVLYFVSFLKQHYQQHKSLEDAFLPSGKFDIYHSLAGFRQRFFQLPEAPERTKKHISTPESNSTCKRLNMFLRWMVRNDEKGVDFGLWKNIPVSSLVVPYDVHVAKAATSLQLLKRTQKDWKAVMELMDTLRHFDANDPVKYDFALFGLSKEKMI